MRRREFIGLLGAAVTWPLAARAQRADKVYSVGYLQGSSESATSAQFASFRQGLHELGYDEGRNLVFHARFANGTLDLLPAMAKELVHLKPDVLFVATSAATRAVQTATSTIPIVFVAVGDPVGIGLVSNLARPEGNTTGITNIVVELTGKRLELLNEVVPTASRIAIFVNPDSPIAAKQARDAEAAAQRLGVRLHPAPAIRSPDDLEGAFQAAIQSGATAALRLVDLTGITLRAETARLAVKHRLPMMYPFREDVAAGGLISYGPSVSAQYHQAAIYVDRILQGTKPATLPVEQPTKFELVINLKTAKALGLTIPPSLLARADEVIE